MANKNYQPKKDETGATIFYLDKMTIKGERKWAFWVEDEEGNPLKGRAFDTYQEVVQFFKTKIKVKSSNDYEVIDIYNVGTAHFKNRKLKYISGDTGTKGDFMKKEWMNGETPLEEYDEGMRRQSIYDVYSMNELL